MSDADWDADDFEPEKPTTSTTKPRTDKWEGEDEDDDVKDSWDVSDDDENSKGSEDSGVKAVQRKKKKKMHEIIAEKEAAKSKQAEEMAAARAAEAEASTPEAKLAEKLRQQKIEEIQQLQMAKEMLGEKTGSIDAMIPSTKEEFEKFSKAIVEKVELFNTSSQYNDFLEGLIKELSLDLPAPSLKKIKIHVETLHSTKLKEEKASKNKKTPGKGRSSVKMDLTKDLYGGGGGDLDELDDFM